MEITLECLMGKEVVDCRCGKKLGYPKDLIFDCECGRIEALVLCKKGLALFQKDPPCIPWCKVERIGEDVIWVKGVDE